MDLHSAATQLACGSKGTKCSIMIVNNRQLLSIMCQGLYTCGALSQQKEFTTSLLKKQNS